MNLDAYTLRKLAPKLLVAVIAVNISIYLCVGAINITNIFGRGLNQLISAPFNEAGTTQFEVGGDVGDTLLFYGILAAAGIFVTISLAGGALLPMIGLAAIPIVLAVVAVLVTLVMRKVLLLLLTIVSPLAISLWILPGTEKYFKQWWSLFLKTLIVYPIIAAVFAATNIMATITLSDSAHLTKEEVVNTSQTESEADDVTDTGAGSKLPNKGVDALVGIMLVFLPLFMIPFSFKFAGGMLGAISGKLSDLQKPVNRMAGRARQKRLEQNLARMPHGQLLRAKSRPARAINRAAQVGALAPTQSLGKGYFQRLRNASGNSIVQKGRDLREKDEGFKTKFGGDDDKSFAAARAKHGDYEDIEKTLAARAPSRFDDYGVVRDGKLFDRAGSEVTQEGLDQRRIERKAPAAEIYDMQKEHGDAFRFAAATELHGINTSYKTRDGKGAGDTRDQMFETIDSVAGKNTQVYEALLMDSAQGAEKANRKDLAPSAATLFEHGVARRSGGKDDIDRTNRTLQEKTRAKLAAGTTGQLHDYGAEAALLDFQQLVQEDLNDGDTKGAAATDILKLQQTGTYSNNINTNYIQDLVTGHEFTTGTGPKTGIKYAEEAYSSDDELKARIDERMKHYGTRDGEAAEIDHEIRERMR